MIYAAESQSLAALEMLVHLDWPELLKHYVVFEINFENEAVSSIERSELPEGWRNDPAPSETRLLGDAWAAALRSPVLKVPSVIVPEEFNYLLNPQHPEFERISIHSPISFRFDNRFAQRRRT